MRKRFFSMLVLLVAVMTGALAQTTYNVTVKEGTEDAANWTISSASATEGETVTLTYSGSKKVKSVKVVKKEAAPASPFASVTAEDLGKLIGADGNIYDTKGDAETAGTTAVAMIAYVGSDTDHATYTHGLAIALADEESESWSTAKSTCEDKPAVSGAAWLLPSQDQWTAMFAANGDEYNSSGLNTAITTAGGTALQKDVYYWSSTEEDGDYAYAVFLDVDDVTWDTYKKDKAVRVRACLAF